MGNTETIRNLMAEYKEQFQLATRVQDKKYRTNNKELQELAETARRMAESMGTILALGVAESIPQSIVDGHEEFLIKLKNEIYTAI